MPGSELPRPEVRDVVTVDVAEAELAAVRALLDELRHDVHAEERAATAVEDQVVVGPDRVVAPDPRPAPEVDAIELSRQIVQDMAATRRHELSATERTEQLAAEARVREAQRRAEELSRAARRDATTLLQRQLEGTAASARSSAVDAAGAGRYAHDDEEELPRWVEADDGGPGWTEADEAWLDAEYAEPSNHQTAAAAAAAPAPASWSAPLPKLQHWAEPAPAEPPASVPPAPARARDEVAEAHEQFWREEAQAGTARSAGASPIEVLLPTAALLILLLAVLLLIG